MNEELQKRILQCQSLPSLPAIAVQVLELAQKNEVDIAEIARVISRDPALSGKILRTVNSGFYGRGQHVSTVSHALVILGLQSVKTLVLGFSLVTDLAKEKAKGFKHVDYWRRSVYAANAARTIAGRLGVLQQEESFIAALLQDIGALVLDRALGVEYGKAHERVTSHGDWIAAENKAIGTNHAEVGGLIAEHWKLPPLLSVPIAHHHTVEQVSDPVLRKLTELVSLSGICADVFVENSAAASIASVRSLCKDRHGMAEADCDAMLEEIGHSTREVASMFDIQIGPGSNFEDILKRAKDALVDLTLQSQQQATALQTQNVQLRKEATTDALTGLANRGKFDAFLAQQFDLAVQSGKTLGLLLLDLDQFKRVNDRHGHPVGDQVLKAISKVVANAARPADLAARYGGEEMALILPETGSDTAAKLAESVRRAVAAKRLSFNGTSISVTISVGVACFEPGSPLKASAHLLKAADLAVYNAKKSGRNCVRVFSLKVPQAA